MQLDVKPLGDNALLITIDKRIAPDVLHKVLSVSKWIEAHKPEGLIEVVPAYTSIAVFFDPSIISFRIIEGFIQNIPVTVAAELEIKGKVWEIPVCYQEEYAADMQRYSRKIDLTPDEVVRLHTSDEYLVYMVGFIPGFLYLGGLDDRLFLTRKPTPALKVPAGSIAIGGEQTGIYSLASPGGWHVIGRTPVKIFDVNQEGIMVIKPGDRVKFKSISGEEYKLITSLPDPSLRSFRDDRSY